MGLKTYLCFQNLTSLPAIAQLVIPQIPTQQSQTLFLVVDFVLFSYLMKCKVRNSCVVTIFGLSVQHIIFYELIDLQRLNGHDSISHAICLSHTGLSTCSKTNQYITVQGILETKRLVSL